MSEPIIIHFASRGQILQLQLLFGQAHWLLEMMKHGYSDKALQALREEIERRALERLIPKDVGGWE